MRVVNLCKGELIYSKASSRSVQRRVDQIRGDFLCSLRLHVCIPIISSNFSLHKSFHLLCSAVRYILHHYLLVFFFHKNLFYCDVIQIGQWDILYVYLNMNICQHVRCLMFSIMIIVMLIIIITCWKSESITTKS